MRKNYENQFQVSTGLRLIYHCVSKYSRTLTQPSLSVVILENTITHTEPELYVVIVHYFKYTSDIARGSVSIQDENMSGGKIV